nr:immunoglobulin light chain junction region [Macaca mulatta]
FMQHKALPFTF